MSDPVANAVSYHTVDPGHDGQRLDNFLFALLRSVPKSHVYRMLRRGEIRVNSGRVKPTRRLQAGDRVRVPPVRSKTREAVNIPPAAHAEVMRAVLVEEPDFLLLNKPAGLAVHAGSGIHYGVIEILRAARQEPGLELVHRLDRQTSGCLLLSRNRVGLTSLQDGLRQGRMKKHYLALLGGHLRATTTVTVSLRKQSMQGGERMVVVDAHGKSAHTMLEPLQDYGAFTLARVTLGTGRTHQIRVHAQHLGLALLGDHKYGDREVNREMRGKGLKRTFLHAHQIEFEHAGEARVYHAPLADDLRSFLSALERGNADPGLESSTRR